MSIRYVVARDLATITLDAPERRNVLDAEMMAGLSAALEDAAEDARVRVVVLAATGTTFCAGADLAGALDGKEAPGSFADTGPAALAGVLTRMLDHPKPIVARVQGHVSGGGNGLVAAADIAVAVDSARFAFSEVRLGVAPAVISVVCLARMSSTDARELFLTGERITASRAREVGLVNRVVQADALDPVVADYAAALRLGGPGALTATKELLRTIPSMSRSEAFTYAAERSASLFASDEARAGMSAFFARVPPPWAPSDPPTS